MAVEKRSTANLIQRFSANTADRLVVLSDPSGNGIATATIAVGDLLSNSGGLTITITSNTPANSTALIVKAGTLIYDNTYLYVATANNVLKRLGTLQTF